MQYVRDLLGRFNLLMCLVKESIRQGSVGDEAIQVCCDSPDPGAGKHAMKGPSIVETMHV